MKKLFYIVLFSSSFLFNSCDTNDDGFYNNVYLDAANLVTINTQPTYTIGDYIYVTADFSRYLPDTANPATLLDVYQTTNGATQFAFSYVIEKKINDTDWEVVTVTNNLLDINQGNATNGAYVYALCNYNTTTENYQYNVGFPLLSAGNYRLSFGYNSSSTTKIELRSVSQPKNLVMNINSTVSGIDSSGYYIFTVN
ncbi:hypothetical protein [Flavobacterium sp.]|jgi:hypothetical protein|uniref:hypothetical protein n=1 Tax=Flavobacterium sp. TaxID=239 RepID=UPI002C4D5B79|nr:hypothetical protein [Flavobacterium sp.]HQA74046.1 hypothetical protein [Flavobacterium sp.]